MKNDLPSFAVLIDADNVKLDSISPILEEITRNARITVRRIYRDFTTMTSAQPESAGEHASSPASAPLMKTEAFELVQHAYKNGQSYFCRSRRQILVEFPC